MIMMILMVIAIVLVTIGVVMLVDKFLPQKMKPVVSIVFTLLSILFAYLIYQSINAPIDFKKIKQKRYAKVINNLKDIRKSQEAHKSVKGRYTGNFDALVKFVENGEYTITQQRDSSFMRMDERYGITVQVDTILIDTLNTVKVKDSLFKKDMRYKTMMNVPGALNGEKFTMKADIIDKSGYKAPVFEASVKKKVILGDQPKDLQSRENAQIGVDEVNGDAITVGSLIQVSTSGNWPPIYDRKGDQ